MTDTATTLNTTNIVTNLPTNTLSYNSSGLSATISGSFSTILPKTLSYQFRVVEWVKDNHVAGVELQVKTTEHDQYGSIVKEGPWNKVPRIKMDMP
jgi:hypothetical protein